MTKWVAVCFNLERKLTHERLARKVVEHSGRHYHVVNVGDADEIDDLLQYVEPELPKTGKLTGKSFCFSGGFGLRNLGPRAKRVFKFI